MKARDALLQAKEKLVAASVTNPILEARILLAHTLYKTPEYILLHNHQLILQLDEYDKFMQLIELRTKHVPIAYLIGYKEFYGRNFTVEKSVLIPRPDSETLIDAIIKDYHTNTIQHSYHNKIKILDLGVGSGCLIITLLLEIKHTIGVGVDISSDALSIAYRNCQYFNLTKSLNLIQSNWFDSLDAKQQYDIIICNPPYIATNEIANVARETLIYEPYGALFSINDGLYAYQQIAASINNFLSVNGRLYIEFGYQQAAKVLTIFQQAGLLLEKKYYDLSGYCRAFKFKLH